MGNFNRSFNRDSRPGGGSGGFNRSRDREMHSTTCSNCGRQCQVPFKPNGSKPVFCSDCFEKNGGEQRRPNDRDYAAPRRSNFERPNFNENRNFERPQHNERPQHDAHQENSNQFASLNAKLDRIITLLTPKPEYNNEPAQSAAPSEEPAPKTEKKPRAPRKPKTAPAEESAQ